MSINPNEDTEFNDALRKHGILPPRPKTPPSPSPPPSLSLEDRLDELDDVELLELEEEAKDDETEQRIRAYHEQRLEAQRKEVLRARFGRVYPIGRDDYTREVTEASKINEAGDDEERGTGVVCFLYKDGIPRSDRAFRHVRTLAQKYPRTKFLSIVELEAMLIMSGAVDPPEKPPPGTRRADDESEDEDENISSGLRPTLASSNARTQKNIRSSKDDYDSDFEFDI
ncbi:hypothetical protein NP233_g6849 [Leucocoprinus birnbaumii]|uniref:Phosducin domain-containing protein n=1 Tax=Leucocoprinus birnbaumii TaxID=56174 RepID=A0AAD5YPM7_9AGAR|nr:hypothetical protein NP233_g6849 [Leucocoprinus birnbaumii]